MCMIAYRPMGKGGSISNAVIDTAIGRHGDGFGLMYRDDTGLHTASYAPSQRKAFRRALRRADAAGVEYAAHFRWATSGPRNAAMAHPYTYEDPDPAVGTVALMHNGVIDIQHDHAKESDTSAFVRLVLAALPSRWWSNPALVYLVNEAIGWSKLTVMTATETFNMHPTRGEWDGGIWYSSSHRPTASTSNGTYAMWSGKGKTSRDVSDSKHEYERNGRTVEGHWDDKSQKWIEVDKGPAKESRGMWVPGYTDATGKHVFGHYEQRVTTTTTLKPYALPAVKSAVALGLIDPADSYETDPDEAVRMVDRPYQFKHAGHTLTALKDITLDAGDMDYEDAVICDTCRTSGTVYVIDNTYYIDMSHLSGADNEDEDDREYNLLPAAVTTLVRV